MGGGDILKKQYEAPVVYIEEYELENTVGTLCTSGIVGDIPYTGGDIPE